MSEFQITLTEEQTKSLQHYVFEMTSEAVKRAVSTAGSDKEWLNQGDAAKWLGVSTSTLLNYVKEYSLPCSGKGGRKFYSKTQISAWLLESQIGGARNAR
ncbi:helix-turn-helix domain-containing protein [Lactococcus lactis]|uniref:Helix-turn-helix domain-containing protein n=1 Tax=Lactococcus lactis TaxID=1358 RepID=A0AAP3Z2W9_9LACT|nr:helix-turn-helix domain-containing protein [Lactococcus lactis]MDG4977303.1 helix-turn-helix domain-containing protein [Lactococcus lactis]